MATVKTPNGKEAAELYQGFDSLSVGAGTDPSMYSSDSYASKKVQELYIGSLSRIVYGAFDVDPRPLALTLHHISAYNTVLCINLRYVGQRLRQAILRYVLESNRNRIRDNLPIMIDWHALKRNFPQVAGATRMYKLTLIRVQETYPLLEWESAAKTAGDEFSNHYKKFI